MAGFEYVGISSDVTFVPGSASSDVQCMNISIIDDTALEGNFSFIVSLTSSDPDVLVGRDTATIIITDDDS